MLLDFETLIKKYNLKINGVIHIGAHYGQEHNLYKKQNINNIVYFEPLKKNFDVLKKNVDDKTVLFNIALGNDNKKIKMFVESSNNGMSSSILEPKVHTKQYPHIVFNEEEYVDMKKLDDIDFDFSNFNMMNIDVQGYELEVFKGSEKVLKNLDYIITEVNREELYRNCAQVDEIDKFLSSFGFERVETSWEGGTWGDAFYKKNG
jgi:FkbM family methyltransferase